MVTLEQESKLSYHNFNSDTRYDFSSNFRLNEVLSAQCRPVLTPAVFSNAEPHNKYILY